MLIPRDADAGARGLPSAAAPPVGAVPVSGPAQRPRERLADAGGQAQRGQVLELLRLQVQPDGAHPGPVGGAAPGAHRPHGSPERPPGDGTARRRPHPGEPRRCLDLRAGGDDALEVDHEEEGPRPPRRRRGSRLFRMSKTLLSGFAFSFLETS